MALNPTRLSDALGAEITGIDLAGPVDEDTCGGIEPPGIRHMHRTTVAGDVPY